MPIKFVTGKPGGGKGLRTIQLVWEFLKSDNRLIVTNLPVVLEELQDWCISQGREDICVYKRIRLLRKDQVGAEGITNEKEYRRALRRFYLYRTLDGPAEQLPTDEDVELDLISDALYDEDGNRIGNKGVVYLIDEIHKLWPSSDYRKVENWVLEYCAEHRHFSDDVVFVTQFLTQTDKQIRSLGQDYEVIRNRGKEKHLWFAGPRSFERYVYLEAPNGSTVPCVTQSSFRINGLANCYKTASRGGDADKGRFAKGLPWWSMYAGAAVFMVSLWCLVHYVPPLLAARVVPDSVTMADRHEITSRSASASPPLPSFPSGGPTLTPAGETASTRPERKVSAYYEIAGESFVRFSDGSSLRGRGIAKPRAGGVVVGQVFFPYSTQPSE